MNLDVIDILLKPEETRRLINGRRTLSADGKSGSIRNIKGTVAAIADLGLSLAAITTGTIKNQENRSIIYFIADDVNSGIFEYFPESKQTQIILQPKNGLLNFDKSFNIHGFVVGGMLYWNDNGRLHKLNINKAKAFTNGDATGYKVIDEQTISYIKRPPTDMLKPYYITDDSRAINNLRGSLFQFRYSYVYDDYEESKTGAISTLAIPEGEMDYSGEIAGQLNKNNCIVLSLNTGHSTVIKIKVYVREGNNGNWGLIETIDKKEKGLGDNDYFDYRFYNSRTVLIADQKKIAQLFDSIPNKAQRLAYLHTNQIAIAGLTEGYDNVTDIDVTLTPGVEVMKAVRQGSVVKVWDVRQGVYSMGTTSFWGRVFYGITESTLPAINNIVEIDINGHKENFLAGAADSTSVADFRKKVIEVVNNNYVQFGAAWALFGGQLNDDEIFIFNNNNPNDTSFTATLTEYNTEADAFKPFSNFKSGATHPFGIVYYDENNRSGFVNNLDNVYLPFITEPNAPTPSDGVKKQGSRYFINWELKHKPPEWATKYQFVYGKNNDILQFRQYIIGGVTVGTSATTDIDVDKMSLDITPLNRNKDQYNGLDFSFPNSSIKPYEFKKGDRVRFITKSKTDFSNSSGLGDLLEYYLDVEILDYVITPPDTSNPDIKQTATNNILIKKIDINKFPGIGENTLIEIYSPKKEISDIIYYEFGESFDIDNPHTDARAHKGLLTNQVFDSNGNLTQAATGIFYNGDTYLVPTTFTKNLSNNINQINLSMVESASASNFHEQDAHNYGRVNIENKDYETSGILPKIRLSGKYFEGTEINGLSSVDTQFEANVSREAGEITGLIETGYTLKVIQQHKITSFYINRAGIQLASGGSIQADSAQAIGTKTPSITDYGTNNPESVLANGSVLYFVDIDKGAIIRESQNGNVEINKYGINSEIKKVCNEIKQVDSYSVITSYNPITGEIMFTFRGYNGRPEENDFVYYGTYIFSETDNKWDAIFYYNDINGRPPEKFEFIGKDYVSFIAGKLWHNETNEQMNMFYGVQHPVSVEMVFNQRFGEAKLYKVVEFIGTGKWSAPKYEDINIPAQYSVSGKKQNSRLQSDRFKSISGKKYSYFLKDVNTYKNLQIFSLLNGKDLKGQLLSLNLVNKDSTPSNLTMVSIDYQRLQLT